MTQRIQAVLHGLLQIRIDETTEAELLKIAPELTAFDYSQRPEFAAEHHYHFDISNKQDWWYVMRPPVASLLYEPGRSETGDRPIPTAIGNWLGLRFLGFNAHVIVLNGKVSKIYYELAWDLPYHDLCDVLTVRSYHGFWEDRHRPRRVSDLSDQAPRFRAMEIGRALLVRYTFDAPGNLVNHAFQVDVSCFWSLRGCLSVRQIAPLLWTDKRKSRVCRSVTPQL